MAGADDQDPTIDIGKDGDLQGFSRAARRRLKAASGRYRLLPSPAGLLIWERTDGPSVTSGSKAGPAVALAGEIGGPGALVDVLNFIHFNQWDGALWIVSQANRKALFFEKGQLLSAQSSLTEDRLGNMLVRLGKLTDQQLDGCAREVTAERRLGTILVERQLVTTHDLYGAVQRQVEEIFHSALLIRSGAFYFVKSLDELPMRLHLDTQTLLLESLRRMDEMSYFRVKLPTPDVVLGRRQVQVPADLPAAIRTVLELVDDRRSLRELASESRLGEFEATKAAYELLQRGLVHVRAAAAVVREAPATLLPTASGDELIEVYNRGLRRLHELLVQRKRPTLLAEGVKSFVSGSARFVAVMEGLALEPDGTLPVERLTANLRNIPPGEGIARLREALAELLLFVLFLAHDDIDPVDEQAIHEQVVRAVERL